jgi:Zinc knuckle
LASQHYGVTQAIQALLAVYNSTVANLIETEQQAGNDVTIAALKEAVSNYFAIATKGKAGLKTKDIEGGFAAVDEMSDKDNLKQLIQETINTTICKYSIKHQPVSGVPISGGAGGQSLTAKYPASIQEPKPNVNVTAEMMTAIIQATKTKAADQIDSSTMLCYNCGLYGHQANNCKNAKNFELVAQVLKAQGQTACVHCG